MQIYKNDGQKVLDFIKKNYQTELPREGILAGQSVCSILLYLKGIKNEVQINDFDIFRCSREEKHLFYSIYNRALNVGKIEAFRNNNDHLFVDRVTKDRFVKKNAELADIQMDARIAIDTSRGCNELAQTRFNRRNRDVNVDIQEALDYDFQSNFLKEFKIFKTPSTSFRLKEMDLLTP